MTLNFFKFQVSSSHTSLSLCRAQSVFLFVPPAPALFHFRALLLGAKPPRELDGVRLPWRGTLQQLLPPLVCMWLLHSLTVRPSTHPSTAVHMYMGVQ